MKRLLLLLLLTIFFPISMVGCAPNDQGGGQADYDQTKKMVVDILKTDEGKKAIQEVLQDEELKQELVLDQQIVSQSIEQTLTSENGAKFWTKIFQDPKFAESFSKSMEKEHEQLIKDLMKDPEYQGLMMQILQDPEMQQQYIKIMSSKEMRSHLQQVITETFESPLFKAKIQEILLKGAEEMQGGQQGQGGEQQQGGGGQGESGGGGGGQGGGGGG
ncbi:spore germination lipoprotein GerD [Sutcliffiella cohnii]|uniref:spore germination lipoprotein GerD n=1 Tax=Sutcliffiella cohnii TaxID=33932 RepID=UPI002E20684B|nr:spore germination lipoprotein GerD [Sutcliffiella cohnii]MED4018123.1 spore germination lipoprotein GerD [Sutcliffiella cohnii]